MKTFVIAIERTDDNFSAYALEFWVVWLQA